MISKQILAKLGIVRVADAAGIVEYRLGQNGLKVLLKEDHNAPVATFMVCYRVGSRHEGAGWTGSAHFFEHLMFKGTRNFDPLEGNGLDDVMGRIGAFMNANTYYDRTLYFEVAPAEHLELCVRLEADRMRGLKNRTSDRDSEMTVVRNEFERNENNPGSALYKEVMAAAYKEHQYRWPVIGARSDVEGVSMSRMVDSLYETFYWPNNATVIIVGDFESEDALKLVTKYFGRIGKSPKPIPSTYTVEPRQEGERRVELRRPGSLPQVMIGYHIPEASHPDTHALAALRMILGHSNDATSRLYKALTQTSMAASCSASALFLREPGMFFMGGTAAPRIDIGWIEKALYSEIAKLAVEPVTDEELNRVKSANRNSTVLQNDDPKSVADGLGTAEAVADWKWNVEFDDKFDAVTPADIMRVAATYFGQDNRTVGTFTPVDADASAKPASSGTNSKPPKARKEVKRKQKRLKIDIKPTSTNYAGKVISRVLPNGLTVNVMKRGVGQVAVSGAIFSGDHFAPANNSYVPTVVGSMLTKGSARFSKEQLAATMLEMGGGLGFSVEQYKTSFSSLVPTADLSRFIDMLADVVQHPTFADDELDRLRKQFLAGIANRRRDTADCAKRAFLNAAYPQGHPFHSPSFDTIEAEVSGVTAEELRQFHSEHYTPKSTILTVVGDVNADEVFALIEQAFATWSGPNRKAISVAPVAAQSAVAASVRPVTRVAIPGKANVDIVIGHSTDLSRVGSEDYFAAALANMCLGGDTISGRLGAEIRDKNGLTYGIYSKFGDSGEHQFGAAPWYIGLSVNPLNIDKAMGLIEKVVANFIENGIDPVELEDMKSKVIGSTAVSLRSNRAVSMMLSDLAFLGFGAEVLDAMPAAYNSLTKEQVDAAIRKYLNLDGAVTAIAGTFA